MYLYRANFSLTDNNIIEQHFEGINNLTLLKIEKSEVREIEVGAFESLIKLEELYLISNKITNISPKILVPLESLKHLDIYERGIKIVEDGLLQELVNLEVLEFNLMSVSKPLPANMFSTNNSIKVLKFDDCSAGLLTPEVMEPLSNLKNISFKGRGIEGLPEGLFKDNSRLEEFVWTLPKCPDGGRDCTLKLRNIFSGMKNASLKEFHIFRKGGATLEVTENLFSGQKALKSLRMNGCNLKSLPKKLLIDAKNLQELNLFRNQLDDLPDLTKNIDLKVLNLKSNSILNLQKRTFRNNQNLKVVDLSNNAIKSIPKGLFLHNGKLENLTLANNGLTLTLDNADSLIDKDAHATLRHLKLQNNEISLNVLPQSWTYWRVIETVNLSNNSIRGTVDLKDMSFPLRSSGVTLDLSNNAITSINFQKTLKKSFPRCKKDNLAVVILENNPIDCDCKAQALAQMIKNGSCVPEINMTVMKNLTAQSSAQCASPSELEGRTLNSVDISRFLCVQSLSSTCTSSYNPMASSERIECNDTKGLIIPKNGNVTHLVLVNTTLTDLSDIEKVPGYDKINSLSLPNSQLKKIELRDLPKNLTDFLDISGNKIVELKQDLIDKLQELKKVSLSNNPFYCDCHSVPLFKFVNEFQNVKLENRENVKLDCSGKFRSVAKIESVDEFCVDARMVATHYILPVIITVLCLLTVFTLCLYHRDKIFILMYSNPRFRGFFSEDPEGRGLPYDVFISYAHQVW